VPEKREHHYIDELSVEPGGRILRSFTKVSDSIADPPPRPRS
jgi:hypothetical protein